MSSTDSWNTNSSSDTPLTENPSSQDLKRSESMIPKKPVLHTCFFEDRSPQPITVRVDSNDKLLDDKDDLRYAQPLHNGIANQAGYSRRRQPPTQQQQQRQPKSPRMLPLVKSDSQGECEAANHLLDSLQHKGLAGMNSHTELAKTAYGVRVLAKKFDKATIHLQLNSVMIITKARDNSLVYLTKEIAEWLLHQHQTAIVYVDYHLENSRRFDPQGITADIENGPARLKYWNKQMITEKPDLFDFVITLGGDGTVLYASTLFQRAVPPIMSFALGSLGFLTNFRFEDFRNVLKRAIKLGVKTNLRMRFTCRVHDAKGTLLCEQEVLNELTVDRGPSPWVTMLELYGDGSLITVAQADGLIIATPTGSTAYSLSAGGSLVHPSVSAICVTPICPHTLSFRPILLPDSMLLKIKVPLRARAHAWASFDGRERVELEKGYYVTVSASQYPFPTVRSTKNEYFESVSSVLNWNKREEQKSFVHLLSDKNQKSYNDYRESCEDGDCQSFDHFQVYGDEEEEDDEETIPSDGDAENRYEIDYNDESELEEGLSDKVKTELNFGTRYSPIMKSSNPAKRPPPFYMGEHSVNSTSGSTSPTESN
ncbi:DEKNAAC101663 [Brettanomyces naardenensis]|uniref:DEKNAAC101663 n=1 Tax=Brettanomyces naardenensis TaxID=13370 RepID=A0A448YIU9_BRENA|nr:DEKNAAC101663 [Brettanomyces naardenensis]